jgi:small subunit ribosomal protein S9
MADKVVTEIKNSKKEQKRDYIFAVGRRKQAVARVRLYVDLKTDISWKEIPIKKGELLVNGKPIASYFPSDVMRRMYSEPLRIINAQNKYALTIQVSGGGRSGQLAAVIAGIARVLAKVNVTEYRPILKKKGFLTRDDRVRERRKVGTGGKARRRKQSPKR